MVPYRICGHDRTSSSSAPRNWCVLVYLQMTGSEGALSHSASPSASAAPEASALAAGFSLVHEEPGKPTGGVVIRSPFTKVYLKAGSTRSCSLCCSPHFVSSRPLPLPLSGFCPGSAVPGSTSNDTSRTRERQKGVPAAGCGGSTRALGTAPAPFPPFPPFSFFFGGILTCYPSRREGGLAREVEIHGEKNTKKQIGGFAMHRRGSREVFSVGPCDHATQPVPTAGRSKAWRGLTTIHRGIPSDFQDR